ncbi:hypothetical protein Nepgr_001097 [Nepenthes gracilis]|uniref:Uncharacterized protein n=1 Tax=Nepenthes gracilis TaxID=150966 RepID=A0AAD3P6G7_NEPGR|nr:hypothetical protein Nepgr_001097 [Nepenthes gracilis]
MDMLHHSCSLINLKHPVASAEKKIGSALYKLQLPKESQIHQSFHVSLPNKKMGDLISARSKLSRLDSFEDIQVGLESVLQTRVLRGTLGKGIVEDRGASSGVFGLASVKSVTRKEVEP